MYTLPFILILLLTGALSAGEEKTLSLSFFVEHQVELDRDYLEIVIQAKAQDTSLKTALSQAAETVAFVRNEIQKFCLQKSKKKGECLQVSEVGKFKVEPQYRTIRGQPVFIAFLTRYEVTAKILQTKEDIGPLVDKIGKRSGSMILSVEWKDADEDEEEMIAIDKGLQEAKSRCKNVGGALSEIESVNEVANFQLDKKKGQQQEEQEQDQPEIIKYKFDIKCVLTEKNEKKAPKPKKA